MAATDSYRLAVKETPLSAGGPISRRSSRRARCKSSCASPSGSEDVELGVHENHVIFSAGDVWLTSRRIDGQFPNYKQLLPESFEVEIDNGRARPSRGRPASRAHGAAQRPAGSDSRRGSSRSRADAGRRRGRRVDPIEFSGEELEIGFNPDFLRDGLEAVAGDTVRLKLINRLRPGLVAAPGRELLVPDHAHPARGLIVRDVTLRDFRSYASLELSLEPGIVLLHGPNGAGKTNLLEALHVGRKASRREPAATA